MSAEVAALAARIAALEDVAAVKELKYRYWQAIDRQDMSIVRDCLIDEAVIDFDGMEPAESAESFVAQVERAGCRPGLYNLHSGQNPIIRLVGDDRATGSWDALFFGIDTTLRTLIRLTGAYDDNYVRINGRWHIAAMTFRQTSFLMQTIDAEGATKVTALGTLTADAFKG